MAHEPAGVAVMEDPTKRLGQIVGWVENPRDEAHDDVACVFPILDGKVLDVDVLASVSWNASAGISKPRNFARP